MSTATAALRAQQQAFAAAITDGATVGALLADSPDGAAPRIGVYRHAYGARLTEALQDNFEILARAMGDEAFADLATAYRRAYPSTTASIRWFGHRLAEFMATCVEAANAEDTRGEDGDDRAALVAHPAFVDLARMDWALRAAFDAADAPALDRTALAGLAPEVFATLRFTLHPSVQLQPLAWAVEAAWRLLREHDPEAGGDEPALPAPEALPHRLLVWRRGLDTLWRSLDDTEALLLQALEAGETFATLCERAAEHCDAEDQAVQVAAAALAQWLDDGLLTALATDN